MFAHAEYAAMDEEERALFVAKVMFAFGVAVGALAITGELLGWWNELGEFLGLVSILATGLALAIGLLVGATRRQVGRVANGVEQGNALLGSSNRKHDETNAKMDESKAVLEDIRDLLRGRDREPA